MDKRTDEERERRAALRRLTNDIIKASTTMTEQEARFLVDTYYLMQDDRKRAHNQVRAMEQEPHSVLAWFGESSQIMEQEVKRALDIYSDSHPVGIWLKSLYGVGPVIAAGLIAHIDIKEAPTAGHIWRFAGLDPTTKWNKGEKRPWNAGLKTLCWKAGQSFMKFSGATECVYGHVYKERKAYEVARNERGDNAIRAAAILTEKNFGKTTEAYKALITGKLPPAQIDARARRYAVKLFLSHLHTVWHFVEYKELPVAPYALGKMDHAHFIRMPNTAMVTGLPKALRAKGW